MKVIVTASVNRLSSKTKKLLTDVATRVGLKEIVVTSTLRTPLAQAEAMLANIENNHLIRYKWAGEEINKIARLMRGQKATREEIIKAMVAKIEELSKAGYRVSRHCVSEDEYDMCNVIDVSYRSMPDDKVEEFLVAMVARKEVVKTIQPVSKKIIGYDAGEPALHFEIKQV